MASMAERISAVASERDAVFKLLGMHVVDAAEGTASISMRVTEQMLNGFGIGHGGITFSLADTAFAFACNSRNILTVAEYCEIKFVKKVQLGDELVAVAKERELTGNKGIYDVAVTNQNGEVVAQFVGYSHGTSRNLID